MNKWQCFALIAASCAAIAHFGFFLLESLFFMRPNIHPKFDAATKVDAEARRLFASNMGAYNLFLSIGAGYGVALLYSDISDVAGKTIVLSTCAYMLGAGVVLFCTSFSANSPSSGFALRVAALVQLGLPFATWVLWMCGTS